MPTQKRNGRDNKNTANDHLHKEKEHNLVIVQIDQNKKAKNNNLVNLKISNASDGFSEGVKRNLASIITSNASDKRQCVSDSSKTINNNSIIDVEVDKSKQNMSISSISGITPPVSAIAKPLSINQCSDNWIQMHQNIKMEEKQNKKRIETFVKHHLFKNLKFIASQEMMNFSFQTQSLNYLICSNLNIKPEEHQTFWSIYSKHVEKAINAARNDAVQSLKRSFIKGKCI